MIRPCQPSDIAIFAQWSRSCDDCGLTANQLESYRLKSQLDSLVEDTGGVAGYLAYRRVLDEVELDQILIGPEYRRRGIAFKALREWHCSLAGSGALSVHLEVRQGNLAAISLYRTLGYQDSGLRKDYYQRESTTEHALLMTKML